MTTTTGRRRAEKPKLPSMLPAEFLTDSSSESEDESALKRRKVMAKGRPNTKINFEEAALALDSSIKADRPPRDQVVGSTVYRVVAGQADRKLAPKMHKDSRNVKEGLLKRQRAAVAPNKKKGFFLKK